MRALCLRFLRTCTGCFVEGDDDSFDDGGVEVSGLASDDPDADLDVTDDLGVDNVS